MNVMVSKTSTSGGSSILQEGTVKVSNLKGGSLADKFGFVQNAAKLCM